MQKQHDPQYKRPIPTNALMSSSESSLHEIGITTLSTFTSQDQFVLSASRDKSVLLSKLTPASNNTLSLTPIRSFLGFNNIVSDLSLVSDSSTTLFAASSWDGSIRLFNTSSPQSVRKFFTNSKGVKSISLSQSCKYLITGSFDHSISIFDIQSQTLLSKYTSKNGGHSGWVNSIKSIKTEIDNELVFISGSEDSTIRIWFINSLFQNSESINNTSKPEPNNDRINVITAHKEAVICLAISKCGKYLASGSRDKRVIIFDISNLMEAKKVTEKVFSDKISCLDFRPVNNLNKLELVVGVGDKAEIFSVDNEGNGNEGERSLVHSGWAEMKEVKFVGSVSSVKWDEGGENVVVGYNDGAVAVYKAG